jgi:NitT/TauT family transport system ATP-binding protein
MSTAEVTTLPGRIVAEQLHLRVGQATQQVDAVRGLDLRVEPGQFVCLLGPSGCGKSTLLSALAGHLVPAGGTLTLDGQPIAGPDRQRGLVFQHPTLFPWKNLLDNVAFGLKMQGTGRVERDAAARAMLAQVGLAGFEQRFPFELSGGMQQRAELARVLLNRPRVLLMDEPFGALDALTRHRMQALLLSLWTRHRTTVVFVTHDIDEALFLGDRVLVMGAQPGRIVEDVVVDLPRPRHEGQTTEPAFNALKRHCLDMLSGGNPSPANAPAAPAEHPAYPA